MIGDQTELGRAPSGYFIESQPMSSHAGLDVLSGPRNDALAKQLVRESGLRGRTGSRDAAAPTDRPLHMQMMQVARDLFVLGLNVDFRSMDWGSVVARRTSREPVNQGGWVLHHPDRGVAACTPGGSFELRGNGAKAWFGWPDDEELERLRNRSGSTRQTCRRRRRSPRKFRCVRWKPCHAFRSGNCSSRQHSDPISLTS